ncbi:hypothetical protein SAMN04488007_1080 [Maribacter aquivivus]|uniref:Uncharacterized protein n=1 Tax=Maribacter aquivivus TaxID=228958 RepID=A0A1M6L9T4_9FLAO|nr:hypothetical protein [Maribacter aquivivus]SHJ67924.1 hypothetical protein SAMN04488007_1080 [Maribacter aquivivus]
MSKIIFFLIIVTLVTSCKDAVQDKSTIREVRWEETTDSLPTKIRVDAKAQTILKDWLEYNALEKSFDKIYTSENIEDFQFLVDELVENQKLMEEGEYPEKFNIPQIKGRQKLFKTYVLKTKGDLEYMQNPKESMKQMITAFNDLRNQFNVVVNNTLPDELLKNEEN